MRLLRAREDVPFAYDYDEEKTVSDRDPFDTGPFGPLTRPVAAIHKPYHQTVQAKRPKHVTQMARRAEELMVAYARGGAQAVLDALTPEEIAKRAHDEAVLGLPEKIVTGEAFMELERSIAEGPGNVIPPQDALERAEREKTVGRLTPDDTQ